MTFKYNILAILVLALQLCISPAFAQKSGDIVVKEQALSKDAIFKADSAIEYGFEMQNNFNRAQQGTLSYTIKTPHGVLLSANSVPVSLNAKATQTINLKMPGQKTGFYKVNFRINLPDYDDTIRRVFGVGIQNIKSANPKPVDFKQFWSNTKLLLSKVAPQYKVTERTDMAQPGYKVYRVEMKSLGNVTVRGWMTIPTDKQPQEKLPVYYVLPGYGASLAPIPGVPHFACIALDVRGLGDSRDVVAPAKDDFITYGIADKNQYILRGAIMDCQRMLDYICSNKDLDATAICVTGGSMGAYLSYALAGLDPRVSLVIGDNPTFSDFRWEVGYKSFPMSNIEKFAKDRKIPLEKLLKNLDYFDLKNFMPTVKAKSIMAIGLLDNFAPPNTELVAYNNLPGDKQMFIYSNLGHEVDQSLGNFKGTWLYTNFNMYKRVLALTKNAGVGANPTTAIPVLSNSGDNYPKGKTPIPPKEEENNGEKFNNSPVGFIARAGSKSGIFKKNTTIYYDVSLRNNTGRLQKGTVTCQVSTKTGDHISITTAAVNLPVLPTTQKFRMNLPLQKGGFFKATFILNLTTYKDTITRDFGVDVNNLGDAAVGTITMVDHPAVKDGVFSSKNTIYYNFDLKNNFTTAQTGSLSCEVRGMDNHFISLTSIIVKLPPNAVTNNVRLNLPTQKRGQYKANFIIKSGLYTDTLRRVFSVDTMEAKPKTDENETISLIEHPGNKDATFKSNSTIYYNLDLKNNFATEQSGRVSCQMLSMDNKVLSLTSIAVNLPGKASKDVRMNLPSQTTGFYKVNFIINTNDYDDTVRRVMGVDIYDLHSPHPKPADFNEFWNTAKQELEKVDPKFKMIERPELAHDNDQVYLIEMQSIGNLTVRGWLTLPKDRKKNEKLPVYLALPGYGADQKPFHDMPDFAALALNVRGQGNSNDVLAIDREAFLTYNILNKNKYIMRGAIMDCVRMVDFIFSRPEFDSKSIYSNGGSMGGYLSLILSSIDHRVAVCTAGNPAFSDWRTLVDHNDFPMGSIQRYAKENGLSLNKILDNLDYFDLKNFVGDIKCRTLIGIGLLDNLAPPNTEMPAYNNIKANKKIFIFPNLGHEVGETFGNYTGKMVYDAFGIF